MAIGMPSINILFKQLATTAVERSARGIACLIVEDDTEGTGNVFTIYSTLDIPKNEFKEENETLIKEALITPPAKLIVIKKGTEKSLSDIQDLLDAQKPNWIAIASETQTDLLSYVKARNAKSKGRKMKMIGYKLTAADDMHVVNFSNEQFQKTDSSDKLDGWKLLPRLLGVLASMPFTQSATYYKFDDLEWVKEPDGELDDAVDSGKFFLFNDEDGVRVAREVNSLTTIGETYTEDMKSIKVVEAMDTIQEDIYTTFKNFVGKYNNKYDNQVLFITSVNAYFKTLETEGVLDNLYDNRSDVNVTAQRTAWLSIGKSEANEWDDQTVKENAFKRKVFLKANIKILFAMEDLEFQIEMA